LPISGFSSNGTLTVAVAKEGFNITTPSRTVPIFYAVPVTFNSVTANGSASVTTTTLTLNFSAVISGLSADDITLSGVTGAAAISKSISGGPSSYTLTIGNVTAGGTLTVAVSKAGFNISNSSRTVTIFYAAPVTFNSVTANGSLGTSTTALTLTFNTAITGLAATDITITNGTGAATRGTLSGTGPTYTLLVTAAETGTISVAVSKAGFNISSSPRDVKVFCMYFNAGDGSSATPFQINTAAQLAKLAEVVNNSNRSADYRDRHYRLVNDINLSSYGSSFNGGRGWTPIGNGTSTGPSFGGVFDGNSRTISNLYMRGFANERLGLFGNLSGATVKNLSVRVDIQDMQGPRDCMGGIAAHVSNNSLINNCHVSGDIESARDNAQGVGGVAGILSSNSTISNSYYNGTVQGYMRVGGIAGHVFGSSTVTKCYSTGIAGGSVISSNEVGGIVGRLESSTVSYCFALNRYVSIDGPGGSFGRVVGISTNGTLTNNAAWNGLRNADDNTNWSNIGANLIGGASITATEAKTLTTYTNRTWVFGTVEASPWRFITNFPPTLHWQTTYPATITYLN